MINEWAVIDCLKLYNFQVIILENLSVEEQIAHFAATEVIVAPHGAGLSNLVYCHSGTKVIECFAPEYINPCYWGLCEQMGLPYFYLIGKGNSLPDGQEPYRVGDNITVDIDKLRLTLELIGIKPDI